MRHRVLALALGVSLWFSGAEAHVEVPDDPQVVELISQLASADPQVRTKAGRELLAPGPLGLRALLDAAAGRNAVVAEEARKVLTSAGPEAIDRLRAVGLLTAADHPERREEAIRAVARMGGAAMPHVLRTFARGDPAGDDWAFAMWVLNVMGDLSTEPLIPLLKHPTPQVRHSTATILSQRGDPRTYDAFLEGLGSEDEGVRTPCARGLGNIGDHRAAGALLTALNDQGFTTRRAAAAALGKLWEPRFLRPLARLARADKDIEVRDTASNVLMSYSHDPVGVRIGKRYKPYRLSPAYELTIQLAFALRFALTGGFLLVLAVIVARRMRAGDGAHWVTVAWTAGLAGGVGFLWGRVVEHIWYVIEYLLLFGVVPAVGVLGCVPVLMFLRRETARPAVRAWLITVGGFYAGYWIGWLALWGHLGF